MSMQFAEKSAEKSTDFTYIETMQRWQMNDFSYKLYSCPLLLPLCLLGQIFLIMQ